MDVKLEREIEIDLESTEVRNDDLFFHGVAILWASSYKQAHAASLNMDWARLPIPAGKDAFAESARLGRTVADLLRSNVPVGGVTTGRLRSDLKALAVPACIDGKAIDPDADLVVDVTWGFRNKAGAVMCGQGRTTPNEAEAENAIDVWINDRVCWRTIPTEVWDFTLGGYPVVKKWLSYREYRVLGRPITSAEVVHISEVVRRLAALLKLSDALDANYASCAEAAITR